MFREHRLTGRSAVVSAAPRPALDGAGGVRWAARFVIRGRGARAYAHARRPDRGAPRPARGPRARAVPEPRGSADLAENSRLDVVFGADSPTRGGAGGSDSYSLVHHVSMCGIHVALKHHGPTGGRVARAPSARPAGSPGRGARQRGWGGGDRRAPEPRGGDPRRGAPELRRRPEGSGARRRAVRAGAGGARCAPEPEARGARRRSHRWSGRRSGRPRRPHVVSAAAPARRSRPPPGR